MVQRRVTPNTKARPRRPITVKTIIDGVRAAKKTRRLHPNSIGPSVRAFRNKMANKPSKGARRRTPR